MEEETITPEERKEIEAKIEKDRKMMFYTLILMGGKQYAIDDDELEVVEDGMSTGKFIKLKQGIINPSMITSVESDLERVKFWNQKLDIFQDRLGRTSKNYAIVMQNYPKPPISVDIFEDLDVRAKFNLKIIEPSE